MDEKQAALDFIMGLQAAGCCCCLTSLIALGKGRGLGADAIMEALETIRRVREGANAQV